VLHDSEAQPPPGQCCKQTTNFNDSSKKSGSLFAWRQVGAAIKGREPPNGAARRKPMNAHSAAPRAKEDEP